MRNARMLVFLVTCLFVSASSLSGQTVTPETLPQADDAAPMLVPAERELPVLRTTANALPTFEVTTDDVLTNRVTGDAGDIYLASPPTGNAGLFFDVLTSSLPSITARLGTSTTGSQFSVLGDANEPLLVMRGDGLMGIGTASPTARLTAYSGRTFAVGAPNLSEVGLQGLIMQNVADGANNQGYIAGGYLHALNNGPGLLKDAFGLRVFAGNYGTNTGTVDRAFGVRVELTNTSGTINTGYGLYMTDIPAANTYAIYTAGADDRVYFGGSTGIGVGPGSAIKLEVRGTAAVYGAARRVARFWDDTDMAAGVGGGIDFLGKYNTTGTYVEFANIKGVKANATNGDHDGNLVLSVNEGGSVFEVVRVARNQVTVTGTVTGTNIAAQYQDLAEWVPTTQDLAAGTVVVLDTKASNHVVASTRPYDTTVAGVVSAQPGLILGIAGPSKAMIATTGRVKVRVDATATPIAIGDLLVTSSRPGIAMKSQPIEFGGIAMHRPGTVVGKALESLDGGEGEILVLLSLQ